MTAIDDTLREALALHRQDRLDEADALYGAILRQSPDHADALHLSGLVAHQRGQNEEALAAVQRAITVDRGVAMYHANLARILRALGRAAAAVEAAGAALALEPDNAETLAELAGALLETDRSREALEVAKRAAELMPDLPAARENLALAHFAEGRRVHDIDDLAAAESHYRAALASAPDLLEATVNLGNVLRTTHRLDEAIVCYTKAIGQAAGIPEVWGNLAVALQETGDTAAAIENYEQALEIDPENAEFRRNRAQALLKLGRFEEGWREFEWRWRTGHFAPFRREWSKPRWHGQELGGETVLVHAEQGFGDSLQFARYLPMVAARGGRVIVECPKVLVGLLGNVDGVAGVSVHGEPLPRHDFQVPMMSLPGIFNTTFDDMPATVPYLAVGERQVEAWAARLPSRSELKVGLVWKGSANHQRNHWRSPGLAAFRPLAELPGIRLFSLQKDDEAADLEAAGLTGRIVALGRDFEDFTDTAAAVLNLDLVISPDTAVAHLAGALARPVWLVLPYASEWRWFEGRTDSPWYPTMRLFNQPSRDDWAGAVAAVASELKVMVPG